MQVHEPVKTAADHARSLAPELGEAHVAQGSYRYRVLRDFEAALASYKQAQQLLPNSALVNEYIGYVLRRLGRWEEAEPYYRKAIELDPMDVQLLSSFGAEYYVYLRRFKEAYVGLDRAIQIAPDADNARATSLDDAGRICLRPSQRRILVAHQGITDVPRETRPQLQGPPRPAAARHGAALRGGRHPRRGRRRDGHIAGG